jgi:hypothetical protein
MMAVENGAGIELTIKPGIEIAGHRYKKRSNISGLNGRQPLK